MSNQPPRLYLAGPEVFRPDAIEYAQKQRALREQYGFIGLHRMDNNVDLEDSSMRTATKIYRSDIGQIWAGDIVVANCNALRGALIDDGTAYELGYSNALGKPTYDYIDRLIPAKECVQNRMPTRACAWLRRR
jgi:nucleoside 2-deoxyribosyltransferase